MIFEPFPEPGLSQFACAVGCDGTGRIAIVDPMRDVDRYLRFAEEEGLRITHVLETHIHADYASGAKELAGRAGELPRDRPIALICGSGYRSAVAASVLARAVPRCRERRRRHVGVARGGAACGRPWAGGSPWQSPRAGGSRAARRGGRRGCARAGDVLRLLLSYPGRRRP